MYSGKIAVPPGGGGIGKILIIRFVIIAETMKFFHLYSISF
jgi:hypothetical protein